LRALILSKRGRSKWIR